MMCIIYWVILQTYICTNDNEMNKTRNRTVIAIMIGLFIVYNSIIYTQKSGSSVAIMSNESLKGEQLWQKNNCSSCHQFYGLGGYLGPDLTNVISAPNKGREYVKAFLNSGVKSMPKFDFTNQEKEYLASFLEHVDQTGFYPNKEAEFSKDGWVTIQYK